MGTPPHFVRCGQVSTSHFPPTPNCAPLENIFEIPFFFIFFIFTPFFRPIKGLTLSFFSPILTLLGQFLTFHHTLCKLTHTDFAPSGFPFGSLSIILCWLPH